MLETGIKVIDLLAPLVQGGSIGLVARQNVGQLALLAELFYRFNTSDYATVFWKPEAYAKGIDELLQEAEAVGSTSAEVYERILQCANSKEVVLGADRAMVLSGGIFDLEEKLKSAKHTSRYDHPRRRERQCGGRRAAVWTAGYVFAF